MLDATISPGDESTHSAPAPAHAHWYCVHTKPRAEWQALENLERQAFTCFLPRLARRRMRARRSESNIEALFPNYLFLYADPELQSLAPVRSTRGAIGLVRFANEPAVVPTALVERLRGDADADGIITPPEPILRPGDAILVADGPLAGLQGIYSNARGEHRAIVLLTLLGQPQAVNLPLDFLQPIEATRLT